MGLFDFYQALLKSLITGFIMSRISSCQESSPSGGALSRETIERLKSGDSSVLIERPKNASLRAKVLSIHPQKCNGCRLCETACALFHTGEVDPDRSRIKIFAYPERDIFLPVCCQHCADAPCRSACPKEAISWKDDWGRVVIDYDRCVSCQTCVAACPYGAMRFDRQRQMVFKCDTCDGNPQCVYFCEPGALTYQDADKLQQSRIREAACRLRR
jgi:carbon-monoxide dehydrogenase iron sulfur subunit